LEPGSSRGRLLAFPATRKNRLSVLAAFAVLGAACARVPAPNGAAPARHAWTRPGVLRLADVADPDSLNPLLSTMDLSYDLSSLMFSYLVVADGRGRPAGDLATAVPSLANGGISRDGKTIVYRLRANATFSDGVPATARDVVFSWQQVLNPASIVPNHFPYDLAQSVVAELFERMAHDR